ncbi:hypothetical protein OVO43_11890, partial [Streptococcus pneumoniae]|nr:hypothetical protein [Streptococcus pneumoniae]
YKERSGFKLLYVPNVVEEKTAVLFVGKSDSFKIFSVLRKSLISSDAKRLARRTAMKDTLKRSTYSKFLPEKVAVLVFVLDISAMNWWSKNAPRAPILTQGVAK